MLQIFKNFFYSFKERPDIWFFYAFIVTSTLSIRKVLYYYPINKVFNEYAGIYLYLSDIFLLLTIATWLFVLYNKSKLLSIHNTLKKCSTWNIIDKNYENFAPHLPHTMFHVEHLFWDGTILLFKKAYQQVVHNFILLFPLFLVIFSLISITWSNNQQIAFFRSLKLFEFVLLFFYIYKLFHVEQFFKNWFFLKIFFQILITIGLIQSIIGIIQFFIQHSIGLLWLKESIISTELAGVAKVIFDGNVYIRSYGLFPHPNIFGGFLVFSIIASVLYFKIFYNCSELKNCSTWNNFLIFKTKKYSSEPFHHKIVPRGTIYMYAILLIQCLALLLTFSKSAIIGLVIGILYLLIVKYYTADSNIVPRGTIGLGHNILSRLKKDECAKKLFLIISIIILTFTILKPSVYSLLLKSLQERSFYLNVSRETFLSHSVLGVGSGQFVINMQNIANIRSWQFQPVHNVFLLVLNDFGTILFFMFLVFIYKILSSKSCFTNQNKCSTPVQMFHVEHYTGQAWNIFKERDRSENKSSCEVIGYQSLCVYFKAIMIAFTFVMIFDHYFWDIQQGQILIWILFGILAGNERRLDT